MNRFHLAHAVRWFLHLHYDVRLSGFDVIQDGRVHLVMPNHSAYIDPLIVASECWNVPLRPMSDERFMRHPFWGHFLRIGGAIEVPDLMNTNDLRAGVEQAQKLTAIAIKALAEGKELLFYPSGHVKTIDKEIIGNRRLAYEVCKNLPDGVEIVLVRMRGLESSRWSKLKPKQHKWRRSVSVHFEDMTSQVRDWAQTMDRKTFNEQLENWYNQPQEI